jgi:hypothetical protein
MAKFTFTGDPNAKRDPSTGGAMYGIAYERGVAFDVPADLADKFRRHNHFTEGKAKKTDDEIKAEHHGGGKFNITRGEEVLAKGLSKAEADAFNALSDEDKAAYVAK